MNNKPFYTDVIKHKDDIICWYRDYDMSQKKETYPVSDYCYCFIPANDNTSHTYKSMDGTPLKRVDFENQWKLRDFAATHSDIYESDITPEIRFMLDEFADADIESPYRYGFYDIEVDFDLTSGTGYPTPDNPFGEINSIQIFDPYEKSYLLFIPKHIEGKIDLSDEEFDVDILFTHDERDMLQMFAEYVKEVDVIGGWYTNGFDLPYIMERAIILFGEKKALTMFCRDGYKATKREFVDAKTGAERVEWKLVGTQHVDMLDLYKKFNPGETPNNKLDTICELEGVGRKIEYTGDLGELYRENPQKFYEYAIHDVRLLKDLDKKTDIIKMAVTISRDSCVKLNDVTGSVKPIEHAFLKFCRAEGNIVLPDKKDNIKKKFPGAIVYDTIAGVHKWTASFDITSLYPSVMIMLGLSPETVVMQLDEGYDGFVDVVTRSNNTVTAKLEDDGSVFTLPGWEVDDIIRESGYTISANGTIFNGDLGILSKFVKHGFDSRANYKKMAGEFFRNGDNANGVKYDLLQKVQKVRNNSIYGCVTNAYFRLYDIRLGKSITLTGQVISKKQATAANEEMQKLHEECEHAA